MKIKENIIAGLIAISIPLNMASNQTKANDFSQELDEVIRKIRSNSQELVKKHPELLELPEEEIFTIVKNSLSRIISLSTNNTEEDLVMLKEVGFTISNTSNTQLLAGFDPIENNITIYYDNIINYCKNNLEEGENLETLIYDSLTSTITHELNHQRQMPINPNTPMIPKFLLEASAESSLYNEGLDPNYLIKDASDYHYLANRQKESLILLLGLMSEDVSISDYYQAIFDSDIESLYRFCGQTSLEEKNKLKNIWKKMEEEDYSYLPEILKIVLANMVDYTYQNSHFSVEENIAVFNIVKNIIAENPNIEPTITEEIMSLVNTYDKFLCSYYCITKEELKGMIRLNSYVLECLTITQNLPYNLPDLQKAYDLLADFAILKAILYPNYISDNHYTNLTLNRSIN